MPIAGARRQIRSRRPDGRSGRRSAAGLAQAQRRGSRRRAMRSRSSTGDPFILQDGQRARVASCNLRRGSARASAIGAARAGAGAAWHGRCC